MKPRFINSPVQILTIVFTLAAFNLSAQKVKHVVAFKYKQSATAAQIANVSAEFKALKGKIPGILSLESGVNNSTENLNKGFTHVFLLTFENTAARDSYLVHPNHKAFVAFLGKEGILEEPFVIDFEVEK